MKWWPEECVPGDMVRVSIGSVKHYGVFISENEIVQFGPPPVTLSVDGNEDICVCVADVEGFSCGNIMERAVLDKSEEKKRLPREKTVELARSRVGEKGYSLLHNNCEHFAYECVFGEKRSTQEEDARTRWSRRPILDVYIAPMPDAPVTAPIACKAREAEIRNTKNDKLRAAKAYDWQVLMYAADRSMGIKADGLEFKKAGNGKWSCDEFHFSLSHTENAVCVAVSNGRVGVDIENIHELERKLDTERRGKLLARIRTKKEAESGNRDDLCSLWLKKECIFKCFGRGSFSPSSTESEGFGAEVFTMKRFPELMLAVCGEKRENMRFYLYENGIACMVNSEIIRNES